ncbi:MAG: 16S rRNA (cytosine(967)-C(5))-methyltransferase RsmB [Bacillota bacterium]|nr:16S rRNA (cytosine(967)-C(5))-methyltransferase RsmB [Bacillota bacterium]
MDKARKASLLILYDVDKNGAYMNLSIDRILREEKLENIDSAFASELTRGVIRNRLYIDWCIERFSTVKLKKISPWILNILRMGIYQLYFMDKVPESASVNESVNLAKRFGHLKSAGFVNAVLRKASKTEPLKVPKEPLPKYLSINYSYPEWMVKDFLERFGIERTESLLAAGNNAPPVTIRTNTLKTTPDKLYDDIKDYCSLKRGEMLEIKKRGRIDLIPGFKEGLFTVQAEPFNETAKILEPKSGMTVLDACAAPGGKTTHIAELMNNEGTIYAFDIFEHKLKLIDDTAKRLGISIIKTELHDAGEPFDGLEESCDRVLLDVPCSGYGIIRRRPDIKWNRDERDEFSTLQLKILNNGCKTLKSGGILVYSTCTINQRENEEVIKAFLKDNNYFELVPFEGAIDGFRTFYPDIDNTDGAFICKMRKK